MSDSNPNQWPPNYEDLDLANAEYDVRTRQRHQRRPKPAVNLINHLLARKGFAQQESANEFQDAWKEIVEPKMQKYSSVGALKRGVLEVIVANSSVSQRLQFLKQSLLEQLQEKFPKNNIRDLRFRIGTPSD